MTGQLEIVCKKKKFQTLVGNEMYTRLDTLSCIINGPKGFKMVQHFLNGPKLSILVQDGQKLHSVVQNGQKCSKWIQYGPKRPTIVKSDNI